MDIQRVAAYRILWLMESQSIDTAHPAEGVSVTVISGEAHGVKVSSLELKRF